MTISPAVMYPRYLAPDEKAAFDVACGALLEVCETGAMDDIVATVNHISSFNHFYPTSSVAEIASGAGNLTMLRTLYGVFYSGVSAHEWTTCGHENWSTFLITSAQYASEHGYGDILTWVFDIVTDSPQRFQRRSHLFEIVCRLLARKGRLELLKSVFSCDMSDWTDVMLYEAFRNAHLSTCVWVLDTFPTSVRHAELTLLNSFTSYLGNQLKHTAFRDDVGAEMWKLVLKHSNDGEMIASWKLGHPFDQACRNNHFHIAQLMHAKFPLLLLTGDENCRVCAKYSPDVAKWLYSLDPSVRGWQRYHQKLFWDDTRLAWVAAVVRTSMRAA